MKSWNSDLGLVFDSSCCQQVFEENNLIHDNEKTEYHNRSEWTYDGWKTKKEMIARVFFRNGLEVARYSFLTNWTIILHEPRKNLFAE